MIGMREWSRMFVRRRQRSGPRLDQQELRAVHESLLNLSQRIAEPVVVESAELLERRGRLLVRVRSTAGAIGLALAHERLRLLRPLFVERVLPLVVGQDARQIETLVDAISRHDGNYKLTGLCFSTCLAAVEFALFDLLGHVTGKSVGELLGGVLRREIPVYLSSLRRDTTPQDECARLAESVARSGAAAVKVKIGGRMNCPDVYSGRTEQLVAHARRTLGSKISLLVDANGSYTAEQAIAIGQMLAEHQVSLLEEPCPWEDFEATKQVADGLPNLPIAGGEQDTSFEKFRWLVRERAVSIVQPDPINNGGFVRTLRVARLAAQAGLPVAYHSAKSDYLACYALHLASVTPNLWQFQEFLDQPVRAPTWYAPHLEVRNGAVAVPTGPGLGMVIDSAELSRARVAA